MASAGSLRGDTDFLYVYRSGETDEQKAAHFRAEYARILRLAPVIVELWITHPVFAWAVIDHGIHFPRLKYASLRWKDIDSREASVYSGLSGVPPVREFVPGDPDAALRICAFIERHAETLEDLEMDQMWDSEIVLRCRARHPNIRGAFRLAAPIKGVVDRNWQAHILRSKLDLIFADGLGFLKEDLSHLESQGLGAAINHDWTVPTQESPPLPPPAKLPRVSGATRPGPVQRMPPPPPRLRNGASAAGRATSRGVAQVESGSGQGAESMLESLRNAFVEAPASKTRKGGPKTGMLS